MKRGFIFAAVIAYAFFHLVFAAKGASSINYKITEYIINSSINKDGSMDVTETITYDFNDKANGVYREIDLVNPDIYKSHLKYRVSHDNSAEGIEDISIAEVNLKDGSTIFFNEGAGENGMRGVYTVDKGGDEVSCRRPMGQGTSEYSNKPKASGACRWKYKTVQPRTP